MTGVSAVTSFHVVIDPDTGAQLAHLVNAANPADHIFNGKICTILTVPVATYQVSDFYSLDAAIIAAGVAQGVTVKTAIQSPALSPQVQTSNASAFAVAKSAYLAAQGNKAV